MHAVDRLAGSEALVPVVGQAQGRHGVVRLLGQSAQSSADILPAPGTVRSMMNFCIGLSPCLVDPVVDHGYDDAASAARRRREAFPISQRRPPHPAAPSPGTVTLPDVGLLEARRRPRHADPRAGGGRPRATGAGRGERRVEAPASPPSSRRSPVTTSHRPRCSGAPRPALPRPPARAAARRRRRPGGPGGVAAAGAGQSYDIFQAVHERLGTGRACWCSTTSTGPTRARSTCCVSCCAVSTSRRRSSWDRARVTRSVPVTRCGRCSATWPARRTPGPSSWRRERRRRARADRRPRSARCRSTG